MQIWLCCASALMCRIWQRHWNVAFSLILLVLNTWNCIFYMVNHKPIFFRKAFCLGSLSCCYSYKVVKELVVALASLRINLKVSAKEIFVSSIWIVNKTSSVKDYITCFMKILNTFFVVKKQIYYHIKKGLSKVFYVLELRFAIYCRKLSCCSFNFA